MRHTYRLIPIYPSDVSGVCSALYELGGMVVIHDPSGCNSTYNTHDEIRWYDQDSLIFISGLTEIDAVMGNDEKFLSDIKETAGELHPKFIALVSSPIPFMNGTDFPALSKVLETETGIPAFAVPTNGMHDYVYGAGKALEEIARRFVPEQMEDRNGSERTVNLLGATPLDFGPISKVEELKKNLEQYGWKTISTWAMGDSLEDLAQAGKAEMNLVISSVGLMAAKMLKEKYGTPYVIGTPYKEYAERISEALEKRIQIPAIEDRRRENLQGTGNSEKIITLIGEPVTIGSLAAIIERRHHYKTRILCPLENAEGLLGEHDLKICGEEEMENALKNAQIVVADPLYRPICPIECEFYERAHIAFSGRMFLKNK
uniref:nitrogenase component 1 n=1 Tax=Mediterraneibacter faecis TaxID=592978 RepID=UPI004029E459